MFVAPSQYETYSAIGKAAITFPAVFSLTRRSSPIFGVSLLSSGEDSL